jgi:hypothetical protein
MQLRQEFLNAVLRVETALAKFKSYVSGVDQKAIQLEGSATEVEDISLS